MSAVFERFEQDYATLSASVGQKVGALADASSSDRQAVLASAESELTQADELLQQMELEARSVPAKERTRLQTRLKGYKADVVGLRKELKASVIAASRSDLLGGGGRSPPESDQEQRLLQIHERTHAGTDKLRQAQQKALEAEAIGVNIMSDLRSQRETIMHSTGTLQRANEGLARGGRVLSAISRRALANKLIMWFIIIFLALLILLLIYLELVGTKPSRPPAGGGHHHANHSHT